MRNELKIGVGLALLGGLALLLHGNDRSGALPRAEPSAPLGEVSSAPREVAPVAPAPVLPPAPPAPLGYGPGEAHHGHGVAHAACELVPGPQGPQPGEPEYLHSTVVSSLDQLVAEAERIVVGRVVDAVVRRGEGEDRDLIFTYYQVEVADTLKGRGARRVQVRVLGGYLPDEDVGMGASHQPKLELGAAGIVFIDDDPELFTQTVGSHQGFLRLEDPAQGYLRDGFGRPIHGLNASQRFLTRASPEARITQDQVVARIRSLVG